jgi:hypothetical protein
MGLKSSSDEIMNWKKAERMSFYLVENAKVPLRPFWHGAIAVSRCLALDRVFTEHNVPPNLVISTGGAGTTFLMKHLAQFIEINDPFDRDRIKHLPRLPAGWLDDRRILYLYASPEVVFRSIRRRGWLNMHAGELGCVTCQFTWGCLQKRFFEQGVQNQINAFHKYPAESVMCLKYENIWENIEEIANFFSIDDFRFVQDFPKYRPRISEKNSL